MSRPQPDATLVTPQVLRGWRLPEPTGGKESRGSILVVGGSTETIGAVTLAAEACATVGLGGATSWIAGADGRLWQDQSGGAGLGVSGSGDVRAGVVAGLLARGAEPEQAAVWAAYLHGRAGERLAGSLGRVGFLAGGIPPGGSRGVAP